MMRAVILTQLVERSLQTPEVWGSKPVMAKNYIEHLLSPEMKFEKTKRKDKEAENYPF